ncbi:MAG: aminotransferase class I/II-fold pyridoxal phosphate-dependent enzyme [Bacteroidales bacterium]|nr:aminotransferase class I/II-fold pyridoxal phosphate-dependent enzyme [Bacteroidales bacterium]MBN2763838.1 aminotransferase class I/II-fold pyridoxal phosphate-dependent enzyme [Bacteroidales bacterium]
MNPQANTLNELIRKQHPGILDMLSEKGKNIFFPKLGILSQSAQAKGKKINASIGEAVEDDGTSMHLPAFDTLINLPVNSVFPYAPSSGKKDLRDTWKSFLIRKNPSLQNLTIGLPVATNGVTHGISMAGYMFADQGDTVVLSDLYWENYSLILENGYGTHIKTFELFNNSGFNLSSFSEALSSVKQEKIILLLNFPNNPAGYTPLADEIDPIVNEIHRLAIAGKKMVVLIDDAYFGLVYEDNVFKESIFTRIAGLHENVLAVKLDGPTKEDYVWGFRVGFITYGIKGGTPELYEALENKTAGAIRGNISNISHLAQSLLKTVYSQEGYEAAKKQKYDILKKRYTLLKETISREQYAGYLDPLPFNSGYFMCLKLRKGIDTEQVRLHLLEKYSTGVIVFGHVIRLAFSSVPLSKIPELVDNLYRACVDLV